MGECNILIYRALSAIAAAALGAAVGMALPGLSTAVEAGPAAPAISAPATPAPMVKADRLEHFLTEPALGT
jgi:hypothetical protein